jgi:dTMP kinase
LLIVFEGIDGCGKGTQIELLRQAIGRESWGDRVTLYKQPGATKLGNEMRRVLFESVTTHDMEPDTASLLFLASHIEGIEQIVRPALAEGRIVIADRWDAYGGITFGKHCFHKPVSQCVLAAHAILEGVKPDLTFLLHGSPEVFLARATARTTETHEAGKSWANIPTLTKVQEAYYSLLGRSDTERVKVVRADADTAESIFTSRVWPAVCRAVRRKFIDLI